MKRRILAAACLAALFAFAPGCRKHGAASDDSTEYGEYDDPGKLFTVEVPANWTAQIDSGMQTKNVSFYLVTYAPGTKNTISYGLTVFYYSPGNRQFASAEDYLIKHRVPFAGWTLGKLGSFQSKTGAGRRWDATFPAPGSPENTREGEFLFQSIALLPMSQGFFVLSYSAPDNYRARHAPDFDHFIESFTTTIPPVPSGRS